MNAANPRHPRAARVKPRHQLAVKTSISLPPKLYDFGLETVREEGYSSLSGLFQQMLREKEKAAHPDHS